MDLFKKQTHLSSTSIIWMAIHVKKRQGVSCFRRLLLLTPYKYMIKINPRANSYVFSAIYRVYKDIIYIYILYILTIGSGVHLVCGSFFQEWLCESFGRFHWPPIWGDCDETQLGEAGGSYGKVLAAWWCVDIDSLGGGRVACCCVCFLVLIQNNQVGKMLDVSLWHCGFSIMPTWQDSGRFKSNSLFFESFALEPLAWLCFILLFFSAHSVWNVKNMFINPRSNSLRKQLRWRQRLKEGPALFGPPMVQKAPKGFLEFSVTRHGCCLFFHLL